MLVVAAPGWGELVLGATAKPLLQLKAETRVMFLWTLHHRVGQLEPQHHSLSHRQPDRMPAASE